MKDSRADRILASRRALLNGLPLQQRADEAAEGGCGVLGFAANLPVAGRHVLTASRQMHNRGNGKGGGIAMVGLDPEQARVDRATLHSHYLLQVALLDPDCRAEMENQFIAPHFEVAQSYALPHLDDWRAIPGLEVRPPDVLRYFVYPRGGALAAFADQKGLSGLSEETLADEFVYQNSYALNGTFYASLGEQRAFVLSHGRNLAVLKIVGYAEDVVQYYCLEDQTAHVWIAHQRYPTKGRVWHPGGAHPFIGLHEALVHNGDFANYFSVSEYLRQRNIGQLFLTDTEVSVQLFDLWDRVYAYPLEITLEAMAPTTEHDFEMLPADKQAVYRAVQRAHIHGSPDGPWFFILARNPRLSSSPAGGDTFELLGITDTSMLRPQVFALYENLEPANGQTGVQIGLIASERQAINACLRSLSKEDERFQPLADTYWVARGGSHTDGGAFRFTVTPGSTGQKTLQTTNKFGNAVSLPAGQNHVRRSGLDPDSAPLDFKRDWQVAICHAVDNGGAPSFWDWLHPRLADLEWDAITWGLDDLLNWGHQGDAEWRFGIEVLTLWRDRRYDSGAKKRASLTALVDTTLDRLFRLAPDPTATAAMSQQNRPDNPLGGARRVTWTTRQWLRGPSAGPNDLQDWLIFDASGFPPEGEEAAARWIVRAYHAGWRRILAYGWRGGRFAGSGLGPDSRGLRLDLYGDAGDYTASGLDGSEVYIHADGQDQVGQILKDGRLIIYGDVGQTFLYGAKGGQIFVLGSAAGRPLINAVGKPRALINGTCLDYLAESFMAGDPLNGGGFVILNGVTFNSQGRMVDLESPYPGGNLLSLASGGAIYVRDPHERVSKEQLNGGVFALFTDSDWALIEPYLQENERLFGIRVEDLLTVDGTRRSPERVYRKVGVAGTTSVLSDAAPA